MPQAMHSVASTERSAPHFGQEGVWVSAVFMNCMLGPQDHFGKNFSGIVETVVQIEPDDGQRDMIGKGGKIRTNNTTVARPSQRRAGPKVDPGRGIEGCENPSSPAMPTHTIHPC